MANIRTARRSGLVYRGGGSRRQTQWISITGTSTQLANPSTAVFILSLNATALGFRPFTVVRARGTMHLRSDQEAASEQQGVALGFCVISDQASAIGVTAIPTPVTDQFSDLWFVYESLFASHGAGTVDSQRGTWKDYDSKAMRKVEEGQDVAIVVESELTGLTSGVVVRQTGRMLIKLH